MFALQETFDMSCLALVEQGEPARDETGCRYLIEDGRRCAAGHLMTTAPREVLLRLSGGVGLWEVKNQLINHNLNLVAALQAVHDERAYRLSVGDRADRITLQGWQTHWLSRVLDIAQRLDLDPARVLEAARAKGWTIPEGLS